MTSLPDDTPSNTAYDSYLKQRYFGSLDGLRFLCIGAVLWHHSMVFGAWESGPMLLSRGWMGVDFFFVLSGFLITTLLLREASKEGRFSLKGFYWRRILRIVPVYLFVVGAVSAYYIGVKGETQYLELVPYYLLFLSNYMTTHIPTLSITWSLSVEEQYYLIWPLLLGLLLRARHLLAPVLIVLIIIIVAPSIFIHNLGIGELQPASVGVLKFNYPVFPYAAILIGSLLAVLLQSPRGFGVLYAMFGARWAALLAFLVLLILLDVFPSNLRGWPELTIHLTMAACLASIVLREDNGLAKVFQLRPLARVGEISYGIYLYHLIALHIANLVAKSGALAVEGIPAMLLYMGLSVVLAEISYRTLEAYFRRFK